MYGFKKVYVQESNSNLPEYQNPPHHQQRPSEANRIQALPRIPCRVATRRLARLDGRGSVDALGAGALGNGLGLVSWGGSLELLADGLDGAGAVAVVDGGRVTEVGVDTSKELAVGGLDVLHDDMALSRLLAVAARPVQLAEVVDGEAVNSDGTSAVLLDDLVFGAGGASTGDGCVAILLESQSICVVVSMCEIRKEI